MERGGGLHGDFRTEFAAAVLPKPARADLIDVPPAVVTIWAAARVAVKSHQELPLSPHERGRVSPGYWVLGAVLLIYVAVCTPQRDNVLGADAWEHHRTVLTLTRHLWHPGNPTFHSAIPSVRYSPYTIFLALVCRVTHITPYTALSIAAVVNTALMLVGLWMLLEAFGEAAAATSVLLVMVILWEGPPGWANSYALADLPWLQVNPSAIAFAFVVFEPESGTSVAGQRRPRFGVFRSIRYSSTASLTQSLGPPLPYAVWPQPS